MNDFLLFRSAGSRTRRQDRSAEGAKSKLHLGAIFTAVFCGAFVLWAIFGHASDETQKLVSDWLSPITAISATVWSAWDLPERFRAWRRGESIGRAGWSAMCLTISVGCFAAGATTWSYTELALHQSPFPSWADAGYLSSFVFLIAGILLLPTRKMPPVTRWLALVDSMVVTTALVTLSWFFILGPTVLDAQGTLLEKILAPLYPMLDLAMLFCVMVVAGSSQDRAYSRVRNLLVVGVLAYVAADAVFGYLSLKGGYKSGNPFDAGWLVANLTIGQAALVLRRRQHALSSGAAVPEASWETRPPSFWRSLLPYAFVPAVVMLLDYVADERVTGGLSVGVHVGCGCLLALILLRQILAVAENSRLYNFLHDAYRELQAVATTDGMTGLPNHRSFQERLRQSAFAARHAGEPMSLMLIDVDRFKQYNDNFGHPAGDEALRIVARIIEQSLRDADMPARYGGEEFAVILPNTDAAGAVVVAERIRSACEAAEFPCRSVTLSIGVALYGAQSDPSHQIAQADQALYLAKHRGRNQVVVAEDDVSKPVLTLRSRGERPLPLGWTLDQSRVAVVELLSGTAQSSDEPAEPLLRALLAMLDPREGADRHGDQIMRYCLRLAEESLTLGLVAISEEEMTELHLGALLHDIGKGGVPDAILRKPDALSREEWEIVRRQPIQGTEIFAEISALAAATPIVRSHHERWDGTGYPDGLAGAAIPLGARLFSLADTLDAMWSGRPYQRAMSYAAVREEIRRLAGVQFDPLLAKAFLNVPEAEWERTREGSEPQGLPKAA